MTKNEAIWRRLQVYRAAAREAWRHRGRLDVDGSSCGGEWYSARVNLYDGVRSQCRAYRAELRKGTALTFIRRMELETETAVRAAIGNIRKTIYWGGDIRLVKYPIEPSMTKSSRGKYNIAVRITWKRFVGDILEKNEVVPVRKFVLQMRKIRLPDRRFDFYSATVYDFATKKTRLEYLAIHKTLKGVFAFSPEAEKIVALGEKAIGKYVDGKILHGEKKDN